MSSHRDVGNYPAQGNSDAFAGDAFANLPDGVIRPGGLLLTTQLMNHCAFAPGAMIVDVGCGTGITVEYLRNRYGLHSVGVDLSEARLQQGRERIADLPLIQAAGEALPFGDASVNGVVAECSLSVMQDAGTVLAEMYRILIPGGKLAITDIYARNTGNTSSTCNLPNASCLSGYLTYGELINIVEENGFSIMIWEDQSVFLREFVARFIMEHGSADELWQCISTKQKNKQFAHQALQMTKLGYFMLVAEKTITKG